jgi:hypothetical protein
MAAMRKAIFFAIVMLWAMRPAVSTVAQIQIGTIGGTVTDATGALLPTATVTLDNSVTGFHQTVTTDDRGAFVFNNVPFDAYLLRVESRGFQSLAQTVRVRSNLPVTLDVKLTVSGAQEAATVNAQPGLIEEDTSSTENDLDESVIRRAPGAGRASQLQRLIATTPGWATEDNGLMHIRGVDDGIVYVVDGIPIISRLDALSASAFSPEIIRSINITTGNIPAEFGGRSGAVVTIQPRSGIDTPLGGSLRFGGGNFHTGDVGLTVGGKIRNGLGIFITGDVSRSTRFLDPPDPHNFHNRGGTATLNLRADWHPSSRDVVLFNISGNGTDFQVPNRFEQELAGQHQRQQLRDNSQSVSWQRVWSAATVTNVAYFRRFYESDFFGSPFDTPLFTSQSREHTQQGIIASLTHIYRGHSFKAGVEASRVTPREFLTFAVTDKEAAEAANISDAALGFDRAHPFVFRDRKTRGQASGYVQDAFSPVKNLTINAGLRYDHSSLLVSAQQFSPRIGAVYYVDATRTAIRGSFNRLYMPPQIENLLLADSEQARRLSPFANDASGGGALIRP